MSTSPWLPAAPAPDAEWMRQFVVHLLARRPGVPRFTARQFAPLAHTAMHLLTPYEASELWDARMLATSPSWRRMAGG